MALSLTVPTDDGGYDRELVTKGEHDAVLCEIVDLGMRPDIFNPGQMKHELRAVFQVGEVTQQGNFAGQRKELSVWTKASLHPKANLHKMLAGIQGKSLAPGQKLDPLALKNVPCRVYVSHYQGKDGSTKDKIADWSPAGANRLSVSDDYVPVAQRGGSQSTATAADDYDHSDIPFGR